MPQPVPILGNINLMLKRVFLLTSLLASPAIAANVPVLTVPTNQLVLPNTVTSLTGFAISETGATALTQFTTVVASANGGVITATGTGVTGSGTSMLTIAGNSLTTSTAFATIAINYATSVLLLSDVITVTAHDGSADVAVPANFSVTIDGNKYLVFSTLAAAQARSAQQCTALHCDGVHTIYWWPVVSTTTGGAIQVRPGDPCFDATPKATGACGPPSAYASATLTGAEQSALVAATSASLPTPTSVVP